MLSYNIPLLLFYRGQWDLFVSMWTILVPKHMTFRYLFVSHGFTAVGKWEIKALDKLISWGGCIWDAIIDMNNGLQSLTNTLIPI